MRIIVFGGTTEGRIISKIMQKAGFDILVCVATSTGSEELDFLDLDSIRIGRLDESEMYKMFVEEKITTIIDATHPYAVEVKANIKKAALELGISYYRLLRPDDKHDADIKFTTIDEAVNYLNQVSGNILVTTGSKNLDLYTKVNDYKDRLYIRVLPLPEVLSECKNLGYKTKNIIAIQGPFSHDMNLSMLKDYCCKYLITKNSGNAGGYYSKLSAAKAYGAKAIAIERPLHEDGYTLEKLLDIFNIDYLHNQGKYSYNNVLNNNFDLFPFFIRCHGRDVLLIGGGMVNTRRAKVLSRFNLKITVLSPDLTDDLFYLLENSKIDWIKGFYNKGYLNKDLFFVSAATNDTKVNSNIANDCKSMGINISVATSKVEGNFYFPALVLVDDLITGISSDIGNHTGVSKQASLIREHIIKNRGY